MPVSARREGRGEPGPWGAVCLAPLPPGAMAVFLLHLARRVNLGIDDERPRPLPAILGHPNHRAGVARHFAEECGDDRHLVRHEIGSRATSAKAADVHSGVGLGEAAGARACSPVGFCRTRSTSPLFAPVELGSGGGGSRRFTASNAPGARIRRIRQREGRRRSQTKQQRRQEKTACAMSLPLIRGHQPAVSSGQGPLRTSAFYGVEIGAERGILHHRLDCERGGDMAPLEVGRIGCAAGDPIDAKFPAALIKRLAFSRAPSCPGSAQLRLRWCYGRSDRSDLPHPWRCFSGVWTSLAVLEGTQLLVFLLDRADADTAVLLHLVDEGADQGEIRFW